MPIYEYRCSDCGNQFELMQKFSDAPAENCPTCSGSVQKLISRSAFHLKGSGWYVTDYGKNGSAKDASKSGTEGGSEGSESKSTGEASKSTGSSSESSTGSSSESSKKSTGSGSESSKSTGSAASTSPTSSSAA